MDQLRQVFTFRFWIVFVLILLLGTGGWWVGTGALKAEIDARRAKLDALNVTSGRGAPNDEWIDGLAEVADEEEQKLREAAAFLWDKQTEVMVWPEAIAPLLEGVEPGDEIPQAALNDYAAEYAKLLEKTWRIVEPFDEYEETGEVYLPFTPPPIPGQVGGFNVGGRGGAGDLGGRLPFENPSRWLELDPSSEEVWSAQEDLWLIRSILTSIREFNDKYGGDSIRNVSLREVIELTLTGGNLDALASAELGDYAQYGEEFGGEEFFSAAAPRSGRGGSIGKETVDFELEEEVGSAANEVIAAEETGEAVETERRYVDDNPDEPFKTRALYLKVVLDHRKLPEFLVELSNSPFPIRILRVHMAERNETAYENQSLGRRSGPRGERVRREFGMENVESALLDPYLAEVAIGGLMTIYRPPADDMRLPEEDGTDGQPTETAAAPDEQTI